MSEKKPRTSETPEQRKARTAKALAAKMAMTPEQRSEIGRRGALKRWGNR